MTAAASKSSKKWTPGDIRAYVMLMIEYLRISPSYALATEIKNSNFSHAKQIQVITELYESDTRKPLGSDAKVKLVEDFQNVLNTFDEFGDLINVSFDDWWNTRGIELFGLDQSVPKAHPVAKLDRGQGLDEHVVKDVRNHFARVRQTESNPSALLVSIPLGITKRMQMRLVSKLLQKYPEEMPIKSAKTSRPLSVQRLRRDPLEKGIHLLWLHSRHPDLKLWRLGVAAKVSKTYSSKMDAIDSRALEMNADDRYSLTVLTHRMMTRAQLIAENAAHGVFPSHNKRPLPVFNTASVYERVIKYKPSLVRKNQA